MSNEKKTHDDCDNHDCFVPTGRLKWDDREHTFQCPKHHSAFTPSGSYIAGSGRATRDMDRLAIQRDGAGVAVDVDNIYEQDVDGPQWAAAVVKLK